MKVKECNIDFIGSKKLEIDDVIKKCNFYSMKVEKEVSDILRHHILLLDVSASMDNYMNNFKKEVKAILKALKKEKNSYVSIVLFSGENSTKVIIEKVKCDFQAFRENHIYNIIDEELYSRDTTNLSVGIKSVENILNDSLESMRNHLIIFTDGYSYNFEEGQFEKENILQDIERVLNLNVSVTTFGFTKIADDSLMKQIAALDSNGSFYHIDNLKDFSKLAIRKIRKINMFEKVDINIDNEKSFSVFDEIENTNSRFIENLECGNDNIIVVYNESLRVNGTLIKATRKSVDNMYLNEFLYSLVRNSINTNKNKEYVKKVAKYLDNNEVEKILESASVLSEKESSIECLDMISFNNSKFNKSSLKNNICLLEVLLVIINDGTCKLLWNYEYAYKRSGVKQIEIEDDYKFIKPTQGFGDVTSINFSDRSLNVGVKVKIDGHVQNTINKLKLDAAIYREYNIILNGSINVDELYCVLSKSVKKLLKAHGLIKCSIKYYKQDIHVIDIKNIKIVNDKILNLLDMDIVAQYLYDVEVLKCDIWALEKFLNDIFSVQSKKFNGLTIEEQVVREEYRVNEKGIYTPLKAEKSLTTKYDLYLADCIVWKVAKFPKAKERKKSLEKYRDLIAGNINSSFDRISNKVDELKREKVKKKLLVNLVRIANSIACQDFFECDNEEVKSKVERDHELQMNIVVGSKVRIRSKSVNDISINENIYQVIKKCN